MKSELVRIITAKAPDVRNRSLDAFCRTASLQQLVNECDELERFRKQSRNLYEKVRALFFLYAIHRFHLPFKPGMTIGGYIPFDGYQNLLNRRFEEAIDIFLKRQHTTGLTDGISSALAEAYHSLGFQTLADQVRRSVRSVRGNQWMFRIGHPADHPLRIRPELLHTDPANGLLPVLREATPVRMDLTHSGWSDIFFLGMDFPEGARVLNVSIDLAVRGVDSGQPRPPIEAYFRVIDRPVLRLASVDLGTSAEMTSLDEIFDFAKDYLGLLKAAVIASGIVPPGMEGAGQPLADLLTRLVKPGYGIEIVSQVNGIPKGSRLAVSTNLLASLIAVCMRATGQTHSLTGSLLEEERRVAAARAILGEWLSGSGGGWQDSGGVWPGMKVIQGVQAIEGNPEFGISRGCLLPQHTMLTQEEVSAETRQKLQDSLVLVHGGMAQDVGHILEMVTEKYLLRAEAEWRGRQEAIQFLDQIVTHLGQGNISEIGSITQRNFDGPIQTIVPWAGNMFTQILIDESQRAFGPDFWGFWMMGGMSGGGMGFIFDPQKKHVAQERLQQIMSEAKHRLERAVPFAIDPVVYDFAINERGTYSDLLQGDDALMPQGYYTMTIPSLIRLERHQMSAMRRAELDRFGVACRERSELSGVVHNLFDRLLPQFATEESTGQSLEALLEQYGFDRVQHEQIRSDLRSGRIGLAQNRLPVNSQIEDVGPDDIYDASQGLPERYRQLGLEALAEGAVAVVSLAGGAGSRWTHGAGVVKALNPFCKMSGKHRTFIEIHLAKSRQISRLTKTALPHVITTSYLTHQAIQEYLDGEQNYHYPGPLYLSLGRSVGLRLIPMTRDLRFAWEEMPQQLLDEQAQKMLESLHSALIGWAEKMGEGHDYRDNLPSQCLHPVGHWYEVPNLLRNGMLARLLREHPTLQHLMIHNIDTLGANVDPAFLGYHLEQRAAITSEVITRHIDDRGGGLARLNGQLRLIEGLALPREEIEFTLSYYNSSTTWIHIEKLLDLFHLSKTDLDDQRKVTTAVRNLASRMPTYITLKDVKKRWGKGQEDIYPVTQFEKLWGDMTALPELDSHFMVVPRMRGQQLKEPAQLDGWLRDGSAAYVEALCDWE
ncbi:UTP--glucose-1-phosphate uridylyltransferase [candidate division KSB3 bacterium]|uniref:UTP--glucose-1-phosphate uridylyltransferase n=1 Tax=candidate division KSB3 bacterium TaxID=2044937 RepID=A0A2G6KHW3_9BACT|nr:MAG: UTP--glucose-1-phosphate uridylyltransferase [candidate division KSB3 bacterium]